MSRPEFRSFIADPLPLWVSSPLLLRGSQTSLLRITLATRMALGKQQTCWATPNLTIDCMLARVHQQLEADGCVLTFNESRTQVATPDLLIPGDFVKVRLWLDDESASINIGLAEVRRVQNHWITVEVIQVSQQERARLRRYVESRRATSSEKPVFIDHLHIRA